MADLCNDYGDAPGCLGESDPRYTMDYTDVEGGSFIYWCARCGPVAHGMEATIMNAFETREGFAEDFRTAIEAAESKQVRHPERQSHG